MEFYNSPNAIVVFFYSFIGIKLGVVLMEEKRIIQAKCNEFVHFSNQIKTNLFLKRKN